MAYGRLDVYWPDGRLESYMLESETVSVGRAEGNTIALDTDALSRYHFSIVNDGEHVWITDLDSANGTYLDGVAIPVNAPQEMGEVEEIVAGSIRMIYRQLDDSPTLALTPTDDSTQRIVREDAHLQIRLDVDHLEVWPASSSSTELHVTNTGTATERFTIRVSGMPGEWLRITRPELELDPLETASVLINLKPPRRPSTTPMTYPLSIEVAPLRQPELAVRTVLDVAVRSYSGFGLALGDQLDAGDPVPLFLHNQGSAPLMMMLAAHDPQQALRFRIPTTPLQLAPGQRMRVDLEIDAQSPPLTGKPAIYPFIVQARSRDASGFLVATSGTVRIAPRLPVWGVVTAAGIALSVLLIALMAVLGLLQPTEPVIDALTLSRSEVMQGEELTLQVTARDVETLDVLVNNVLTDSGLPGDQQNIPLDTSALSGTVVIDIIGRTGNLTTSASVSVEVTVPAAVLRFEAQPASLIRNTVSTLVLEWEVRGAQQVRISGLSQFTNQLFVPSTDYPATYRLEGIGGIPVDPLELTLRALDERGVEFSQVIMIPVLDPQCTAQQVVLLHEGPDSRYQQVAQVPAGATVIVSAQDGSAGWLRVELSGGLQGWGEQSGFQCAQTFNLSDLRTEFNVPPLPTETARPTIAPTTLPEITPTSTP